MIGHRTSIWQLTVSENDAFEVGLKVPWLLNLDFEKYKYAARNLGAVRCIHPIAL